jgi:hypothetical protein
MDKQKTIEIKGRLFRLNIPTFRHKILIKSLFAQLTRGNASLMAFSGTEDQQDVLKLAEQIAELDVLVTPLKTVDGKEEQDFDFRFADLDAEDTSLIDEVSKELSDFIDSFRNSDHRTNTETT